MSAAAGRGRFWGGDDSESSDSEDSRSETSSVAEKPAAAPTKAALRVAYESDSDSDDAGAREARSRRDRAWEGLFSSVLSIHNQLRINNWVQVDEEFDKLNKQLDAARTLVSREGVPRFYIRTLVTVEDAVNGVAKSALKTWNQNNAKAYTRVKMALKKNNDKHTAAMAAYRAAPDTGSIDDTFNATSSSTTAAAGTGGTAKARSAAAAAAAESDSEDEVVIGRMGVTVARTRTAAMPESDDDDDDDEEDEDSGDDKKPAAGGAGTGKATGAAAGGKAAAATGRAAFVKKSAGGKGGDDEADEWDSGADSEDEDEEIRPAGVPLVTTGNVALHKGLGRAYWLKKKPAEKHGKGGARGDVRGRKDSDATSDESDTEPAAAPAAAAPAAAAPASAGAASTTATATSSAAPVASVVDLVTIDKLATEVSKIIEGAWSKESLEARVLEELAARGRRAGDPRTIAARLGALAEVSVKFGAHTAIPTLMHAVSARFDLAYGRDGFMDRMAWKRSARDLGTILNLLEENTTLRMAPVVTEELEAAMAKKAEKHAAALAAAAVAGDVSEDAAAAAQAAADAAAASATASSTGASKARDETAGIVRVVGDLAVLVDRLFDEYIKSLQQMDPHKMDYIVRISDEASLHTLADRGMKFYNRIAATADTAAAGLKAGAIKPDTAAARGWVDGKAAEAEAKHARDQAARLAILLIEQMYYKHDSVAAHLRITAAAADQRTEVAAIAASAITQAMAEARSAAVEARRVALAAAQNAAAVAAAPSAGAVSKGGVTEKEKTAAAERKEETEAAAVRAAAAASDPRLVGEAAAALAATKAVLVGKRNCTAAAGIIARAVVNALAAVEGSLLSAGAVDKSRSPTEMETLADAEAAAALAQAEAAGVDLGALSTAAISAAAGAVGSTFDSAAALADLAGFVYKHGELRSKTRAVLMHIYHHALHDRFHAGRDLLLMSKLQESINATDVKVQIAFNRAMTMLGIAAFRAGLWSDAHECLSEITGSGHARELLAQGLSQARTNAMERDMDLDREERRRLVPYHMHINVELADACALTAAMLLEVPNIAAAEHDNRRREISRTYRRLLDAMDGRTFVGPPESTRDIIMMAGLALAEGEWKAALDHLTGIKVWALWSTRGLEAVRERLTAAVKEAALATYLYTYSGHYDSMSLAGLSEMFALPLRTVHAVSSKMIYNNEIAAKLDQPTGCLVLHRAPPTRLQALALEFADRVGELVEFNERSLAQRTGTDRFASGGFGDRFDDDRRGGYRRRRFDQGRMGSAAYAGHAHVAGEYRGGGRGGRGGSRGGAAGRGGRYGASGHVPGYGAAGSAKRTYQPRGF